eukprot:TRINITY_DN50575_c0_g1_i1.p1 TRINITY_DN50575_c0_g1~~TRINITY_DN50575_c0_g1_i1.p1  ORF type:complete len:117 (+),score=3.57 TRINITY_DN50575_c0_g1_i1:30-380(+)
MEKGMSGDQVTVPPSYSAVPNVGNELNAPPQPRIVHQPIMFGKDPINMVCNHCGYEITTSVAKDPGLIAYSLAGAICVVGFFCGCCLIPLGMDSLKDAIHTCPNCKVFLGKYKALM